MLTPNVILSAVEGSLQQQTRCLHYGRHDIYAFFSIWVNCYIITKVKCEKLKRKG